MNRIANKIRLMQDTVAKKTQEDMVRLSKELNVDFSEHFFYQNCKSRAQVEGILSYEEAITVYSILGETVDVFNSAHVAEKIVITNLMKELLEMSIKELTKS